MNSVKLFKIFSTFCILCSTFLVGSFCYAGEIGTAPIDSMLLEERVKDVVWSESVMYNVGDLKNPDYKQKVKYDFKSDIIGDDRTILFVDNNLYSNIEIIGDNVYKIYSGVTFYKENDITVRQIESAFIDQSLWNEKVSLTPREKLMDFLKIYTALADSYTPAEDKSISKNDSNNWDTTHDATSGTFNSEANQYVQCDAPGGCSGANYFIRRYYLNFDTSAIDSNSYFVASSSLHLKSHNDPKSGTGNELGLYKSTAGDTLSTDDFNNFETTSLANKIAVTDWGADNVWNTFLMNDVGTSTIETDGITKLVLIDENDITDEAPTASCRYFGFSGSATSGTDEDPFLLIDLQSLPEEEPPEEPEASSTPIYADCVPSTNNDLSLITACSISSGATGTTTTTYVYHIPFIVWLVLFLIFNFIIGRLVLEFIIFLRQK